MTPVNDTKQIQHMRQILLWPVYFLPLDDNSKITSRWESISTPASNNPWREVDDEFGDPSEFQERHYNEFISFLPPVQRFLYGQGLGHAVKKGYGESPIRILRRTDISRARVTLERDGPSLELIVKHVDLYFFYDIDVVILALEVFCNDLPLNIAQELLLRFGRTYPSYWDSDTRGGHCPWRVEWLSEDGTVLSVSDYENKEKYLSFVCKHRAPAISSHWEFLLSPMVLYHSEKIGDLRYRQLEYYRMPQMVYLSVDNPSELSRADYIRLGFGSGAGEGDQLPFSSNYLKEFEERYCYDRNFRVEHSEHHNEARFIASGYALALVESSDGEVVSISNNRLFEQFRHQYFLMFLIAHFQKASLRMFSDRLVASVSQLQVNHTQSETDFRINFRLSHENFLRFSHRYWYHEIANHGQMRELFDMTREHLFLDALYQEVREELSDMGRFLDDEAMRRQNETVIRLTVVTTFGLMGSITSG
ncbi:MAG: hypothetical protein ACKOW3_08570, partial [Hyphomicrobium sp.]